MSRIVRGVRLACLGTGLIIGLGLTVAGLAGCSSDEPAPGEQVSPDLRANAESALQAATEAPKAELKDQADPKAPK